MVRVRVRVRLKKISKKKIKIRVVGPLKYHNGTVLVLTPLYPNGTVP